MGEFTVTELAEHLGVSSRRARMLLAEGTIAGRQLPSGLWLADSADVHRFTRRRHGAGRALNPDTAWALLYELSGVRAGHLLPRATYTRARARIRTMTAEGLAAAVAGRTRTHRFRAANAAKAQDGLIATARPAANLIGSDLIEDTRRVAGYVPTGTTVEEWARSHFMVADTTGFDVLYENTAPEGYATPLPAVVAADLALSLDTRERSAGLRALDQAIADWRAAHPS